MTTYNQLPAFQVARVIKARIQLNRPVPGAKGLAAAAQHGKVLELQALANQLADIFQAFDGTPRGTFLRAAGVWPEVSGAFGRELRRIARAVGDLEPVVDRFEASS